MQKLKLSKENQVKINSLNSIKELGELFSLEQFVFYINSIVLQPINTDMKITFNKMKEQKYVDKFIQEKIEGVILEMVIIPLLSHEDDLDEDVDILVEIGKLHIKRLTNNRFFSDVEESSLVAKSEEHKNDIEEIEERYQDY